MSPHAEVAVVSGAVDLDVLFRSHYGRLVRALTVVAGDRDAAADAVQEAFVKAHLHWRRIRRYDDPVGWIRRVAVNRLRDDHRRSQRRQRALDRLAGQTATSTDDTQWSGGDADLAALLGTLPRQQRVAIALYYVDGLTVAEVASAMGVSQGAVKFHLHQGRERLGAALRKDER